MSDPYSPYRQRRALETTPEIHGWAENFEGYINGQVIDDENLDVTSGGLVVREIGPYMRGQLQMSSHGGFRAVALVVEAVDELAAYTDGGVQYRFNYKTTGPGVNPGFKAFVRYQTENDLYVASWRLDGSATIQSKIDGVYRTLSVRRVDPPKPGAWYTLRFVAEGTMLKFTIKEMGEELIAFDENIRSGTVGIRTDGTPGAYIDDWKAVMP